MTLLRDGRHSAMRGSKTDDLVGAPGGPCTADTDTGERCGRASVPDAPYSVCTEHLLAAYRHVNRLIDDDLHRSRRMLAVVGRGVGGPGGRYNLDSVDIHTDVMNGWESVVYYIECGGHIKIGHSQRMFERMRSYPPSARVLALEPGFFAMERRRQRQFKSLLAARIEWFHPGDKLMDHIASLAVQGLPLGPLLTGVPAPAELTS